MKVNREYKGRLLDLYSALNGTNVTDEDLARRCRETGLERARNFSWDRSVEQTLRIIQESV